MPRHWPVKVPDDRLDREWFVGSLMPGNAGQVVIPLDQIHGMTDAEIGASVRALEFDALFAVGMEIADHWRSNNGARVDADDFDTDFGILLRLAGEHDWIDEAIAMGREAILRRDRKRERENRYRPRSTPGFIYLVKCGPYFKIGRTKQVSRRMVELGVQMPHPIEVISTHEVLDMVDTEREIHALFAHKRLNGEWFDLDIADLRTIETYFQGDDQDWYEITEAGR